MGYYRLRRACAYLRHLGCTLGAGDGRGQCTHAGDRCGDPGRRQRLSRAPIYDHCAGGRGHLCHRLVFADTEGRGWLSCRCHAFGCGRLYRHAGLRSCQCSHNAGFECEPCGGTWRRLQVGRGDGHAGGRSRASFGDGLFFGAHGLSRLRAELSRSDRRACRARLRRFADLDLRASRWRHLHQGRRCGR